MSKKEWFDKIENPLAREWFKMGNEDFRYAKDTFSDTENYRMICFICHQVFEKYLKGYLQLNGCMIPRIHNLLELAKISAKLNKHFLNYEGTYIELNDYYIDTRYPVMAYGEIFKKKDAFDALRSVKEFEKFIIIIINNFYAKEGNKRGKKQKD